MARKIPKPIDDVKVKQLATQIEQTQRELERLDGDVVAALERVRVTETQLADLLQQFAVAVEEFLSIHVGQ